MAAKTPSLLPETRRRVKALEGLIRKVNVVHRLCTLCFWICVGVVFQRVVPPEAETLEALRQELSSNWLVLNLKISEQLNPEDHDWASIALPMIFIQTTYRILYDGFIDDRKTFSSNAQPLLDKLMLVIMYEISGFQLNVETLRKMRRRLFIKRVVLQPHTDQRAFMNGVRRQEKLDDQKAKANQASRTLAFGSLEGQALEETQLEHILNAHDEGRPQRCIVPSELSVRRYARLEDGGKMMERHLEYFACLDRLAEEGNDSDSEDEPVPVLHSPSTTSGMPSPVQHAATSSGLLDDGSPSSEGEAMAATMTSTLSLKSQRKVGFKGGDCSAIEARQKQHGEVATPKSSSHANSKKRGTEAKARAACQQSLQKIIAEDPLPSEFQTKALNTGWVSPVAERLNPGAIDRADVLKMPAKHCFQLKMQTPLVRPMSSQSFRKSPNQQVDGQAIARSGEENIPHSSNIPPSRGAGKKTATKTQAQETESLLTIDGNLLRERSPKRSMSVAYLDKVPTTPGGATVASTSTSGTLQRQNNASGNILLLSEKQQRLHRLELQPPKSLTGDQVKQRLEDQAKGFSKQTFTHYMKEYDILTGKKKEKVQSNQLQKDEHACLKRHAGLLGGEPQRIVLRTNLGVSRSSS